MMALRSVLGPHLGWGGAGAGAIKGAAARRGVTRDYNLEQHGHWGQPLDSTRCKNIIIYLSKIFHYLSYVKNSGLQIQTTTDYRARTENVHDTGKVPCKLIVC